MSLACRLGQAWGWAHLDSASAEAQQGSSQEEQAEDDRWHDGADRQVSADEPSGPVAAVGVDGAPLEGLADLVLVANLRRRWIVGLWVGPR